MRSVSMSRVYGLDLHCWFAVAEHLIPSDGRGGRHVRHTRVDLLEEDSAQTGAARGSIRHAARAGGRLIASLDLDPAVGYKMFADRWGTFVIAEDGSRVGCRSPQAPEPWLF